MRSLSIADYALLSDCHTAALVSRSGSIDWLCARRFDRPSIFARLLDDRAGHWSIRPVGDAAVSRRYHEQTMVLSTRFTTPTGIITVDDALAVGRNERGHDLGLQSPGALLRRIACSSGEVEVEVEYAPRPEYGRVYPLLQEEGAVGVTARGGANILFLCSPVPLLLDDSTARARFVLRAGEQVSFALQHRWSWEPSADWWSQQAIDDRMEDTIAGWRAWCRLHQAYEGPWRELVHQSGRVLQALTYQPTGAIVAAPTSSLPESVGGVRNWDYRYTWIRDASLTLDALWVAACPDEAHQFFAWMTGAAAMQLRRGVDLQIVFGVGGELDLTERTLDHLAGWRESRPVRVGNGAWTQRQLDVYGELLGAARRLSNHLGPLDRAARRFLVEVGDAAAAMWRLPDQGLWEMRTAPRHFLHSKLMCWAALDCAIQLVDLLGAGDHRALWAVARDQVREAILSQGWSEKAQAFTQAFGSDDLDASALMLPIVGFLPATDPRMRATIAAIRARLTDARGLVYRYQAPDGFEGGEGTFLLCTFWLAQALAMAGEVQAARDTFERAAAYANDLGLLAEEVDNATGELLGNFPQAFSHIGLVNAAWAIAVAERQEGAGLPPCQDGKSDTITSYGYQPIPCDGPRVASCSAIGGATDGDLQG